MDRNRNGIRAALVRLLRVYDRELALDKAVRGVLGTGTSNYHSDNWSEIMDAICYMTGDITDKLVDSQTYKILTSSIDKSRKIELLMVECDRNAPKAEPQQPAPVITDPKHFIELVSQNGGYVAPEVTME